MVLALEVSDLAMDLTRRYVTIPTLIRNNDHSIRNIIAVNEHGVRYTGTCLHITAGSSSLEYWRSSRVIESTISFFESISRPHLCLTVTTLVMRG